MFRWLFGFCDVCNTIEKRGGSTTPITGFDASEGPRQSVRTSLRTESIQSHIPLVGGSTRPAASSAASSHSSTKAKPRARRTGVSAETVTKAKLDDWVKPSYPKSEADKAFIRGAIQSKLQLLFGSMSEENINEIIAAMFSKSIPKGVNLIRQGDQGDHFYIVASGKFDIFVQSGDSQTKVASLGPPCAFGELALMYNAPRNATCQSAEDSKVWCLDRQTFRLMLVSSQSTKSSKYLSFLQQVDILKTLKQTDLAKLVDLLEPEDYEPGADIVSEGDVGDKFYIIESGTVAAFVKKPDGGELQVKKYERPGEYFGEVALLADAPRKATVRCLTQARVLSIDKETFDRVLGSIKDSLKDQAKLYSPLPTTAES